MHSVHIVSSWHRISVPGLVTSRLMLAAKFFDDIYYTNAYYAEIGGIAVSELNSLEVDFLCRIHFSLHVSPQEYQRYYTNMNTHCRGCMNCCKHFIVRMTHRCDPAPWNDQLLSLRWDTHAAVRSETADPFPFGLRVNPVLPVFVQYLRLGVHGTAIELYDQPSRLEFRILWNK